jgi:hypothetical protein
MTEEAGRSTRRNGRKAVFAGGRRMRMKEVGVMKEMLYPRIKTYEMFRSIGKPGQVILGGLELNRMCGSNCATPEIDDDAS